MKRKEIPSKKVIKNSDVKAHLEAIKGSKIDPALGIPPVNLFYVLGTVVQTNGFNNVTTVVTYRNLLSFGETTQEHLAPSLDVSGVSSTGSNGNIVFTVMSFVPYELQKLAEPVHIVATPHGSVPSFLTVEHALVGDSEAGDVEITVYAWDSNGNPAPDVAFDWRCRLNGLIVELLD
jgi:hypothetical protein